jgi:hypothetical protein
MAAGADRAEPVGTDASLISKQNLHELFRAREPTRVQFLAYRNLRRAAYEYANAILVLVPESPQQQQALRSVRDALFAAREAIEGWEVS